VRLLSLLCWLLFACTQPEPPIAHAPWFSWNQGLSLDVSAIPADRRPVIQAAANRWAGAFRALGCSGPRITVGTTGAVRVTIGELSAPMDISWSQNGPEVTVGLAQATSTEIRFADVHFIDDTVSAHEIGHMLGLGDVTEFSDVMAAPFQSLPPAIRDARAVCRGARQPCGSFNPLVAR
jgi:hypothetical protein